MIITIDNFDGAGVREYTAMVDAEHPPKIARKLNRAAQAELSLVSDDPQFVVPAAGGRIKIGRGDGYFYFTGNLTSSPEFEYLGWGEKGPAHRYFIQARSDEWALDRKRVVQRPPFVMRSAGASLRQLTEDISPGAFDLSGVDELDVLPVFAVSLQRNWSDHVAQIALRARASYRVHDGKLSLKALGAAVHTLDADDESANPEKLKLIAADGLVNDVTVLGQVEPRAFVKNYFLGDGISSRFSLSHSPFTRRVGYIFEEEFKSGSVDPTLWTATDPSGAFAVSAGKLQVDGGDGVDGHTYLKFQEQMQLGGAVRLQHGEIEFTAATDALIGGLYTGTVTQGNCFAGFRVTPSGGAPQIQGVVNGGLVGTAVSTVVGHKYALTTRLFSAEPYRTQQTFHSSVHVAGNGRGGSGIASQVRVVLEIHDIDPANPGSLAAPAMIIYDGFVNNAPSFCTYALVNALNANCSISFVSVSRGVDAEVRSTVPGFAQKTRLPGNVAEGAECVITQYGALQFFSPYVPVANEAIVVHYRSAGRALARIIHAGSIAAHARAADDGVRAIVTGVVQPAARTSVDCENAALAILDDSTQQAWAGEYECWSDFQPGGANVDPLPGDAIAVSAPSRAANFTATILGIDIEFVDLSEDRRKYKLTFANDAAQSPAFELAKGVLHEVLDAVVPGTSFIANLPDAEITGITSTTVAIDSGSAPLGGGGVEMRRSDGGWNPETDHNLIGRFTTQAFTVPRLARVQTYYLRQFDSSTPRKYSRYSTVLYVDYPF